MFIQKLKIQNFQKHSNIELEFINGLNVLYGHSDCGKSCIRRALEWVIQNENIDGIRKIGTKQTSVCVILNNHIEIERVRSQAINRYIIRKDGQEQIFDAVGRDIPSEVKDVLTIYPIEVDDEQIYLNSQPQIGLPFLFDKSPSFRMKLFNKLTGNDVLDKLFSIFNKNILQYKKQLKEEKQNVEIREQILINKQKEKEKAEVLYDRLNKRISELKKLYEYYDNLLTIQKLYNETVLNKQTVENELQKIKIPELIDLEQLKVKIQNFNELNAVKNALESTNSNLTITDANLQKINVPDLKIDEIRHNISTFDTLNSIFKSLQILEDSQSNAKKAINDLEKTLEINIRKYKSILKESGKCPICYNSLTEDCLKQIHL